MRIRAVTAIVVTLLTVGAGSAQASTSSVPIVPGQPPAPPAAAAQLAPAAENVKVIAAVPDTTGAISMKFSTYQQASGDRDIMFVNGTFGLRSYDVTDPDKPVLLDHLTRAELARPGDDPTKMWWENEDVDVDHQRKLVFMARERNALGGRSNSAPTGVYIVSAVDPADLKILSFAQMGTGHTTTCVNDCQYLWTAGYDGTRAGDPDPYRLPGKIFVTDIRDPANPKTSTTYVDLKRNQGESHMTHDVQVDADGVAWVAGTGGTRGYYTAGRHTDPLTGALREATATDPIPYGGGGSPKADMPTAFSHNSWRPVGATLADGPEPTAEQPAGSLLLQTEEAFDSPTCADQGRLVISSITGSLDGDSWRATPQQPYYMSTVGLWSPNDQEGTVTGAGCSAHYFDVRNRIVAQSYYQQGTRFVDISNPAEPIQIAYYRPQGTVSWAPYWFKGRVYIADNARGVEIVSLTDGAAEAQRTGQEVVLHSAPVDPAVPVLAAAGSTPLPSAPLVPDDVYGWVCPHMTGRGGSCEPGSVSCC